MKRSKPSDDPIKAFQRKAKASRRTGINNRCACGETRVEALIANTGVCAECLRKRKGQDIMDDHHVAGKANSPATVAVPVNDHWAVLSEAQYDWPKATVENPEGCPLLAAAGCIRGFIDTTLYLIDELLHWIAKMLEVLSALLLERFGTQWWLNTPLARFARKG
jgi:hypothetical protein